MSDYTRIDGELEDFNEDKQLYKKHISHIEDELDSLEDKYTELNQSLADKIPADVMCYRGTIGSSTDLNELFTTGSYSYTTANNPSNVATSAASLILVFYTGSSCSVQISIQYNNDTQAFYYRCYHSNNEAWRPWRQISSTAISTTSATAENSEK